MTASFSLERSAATEMVATSTKLTASLLTEIEAWAQVREDWQRLYAITPGVTPWQSWEFLSDWWRFMAGSRSLCICVVTDNETVQLIVPLQISVVRTLGFAIRVLEPIGMPDDINRPRLALGTENEASYASALAMLWQHRAQWDALRLDEKVSDDWETRQLHSFSKRHSLRLRATTLHPCPYLDLRQPWSRFIASRSTRLRKNLRAAARRLDARGAWLVQRYSSAEDVEAAFDTLLAIHTRSWKESAQIGLAQGEDYRAFYRGFVSAMARRNQVNVWILWCNDRPVAGTVAFHEGTTYFSAQIAHDEAYAACSPGTLLEAQELEVLMNDGRFENYDFLGAALANKLRWTDTARGTYRVYLAQPNIANTLIDAYYFRVKPVLRRFVSAAQGPRRALPGRHP